MPNFALQLVQKTCTSLSTNQITTWSFAFSRALGSFFFAFFTLSSHWLSGVYSFRLIGFCDFFGFCFTTLNRKALKAAKLGNRHHLYIYSFLPMLKKVVRLKKRMISVQSFRDDPMNLKIYIRSGQCDQGTVHVFLSQVASALHYLHTQHIVHENLCAENVTVVEPYKVTFLVRFTHVTLKPTALFEIEL